MKLVFIDKLRSGMVVAQDILHPSGDGIPLVRSDAILTDFMIEELGQRGVRFAYVDDTLRARNAAEKKRIKIRNLSVPIQAPVISRRLQRTAVERLQNVFDTVSLGSHDFTESVRVIKELDKIVGQLVDSISGDRTALISIKDLKSYDDYTYHHSLSVAVLTIAIGQYIGYNKATLNRLGMCAIMHDIGKTAVPVEIIQKPSRLTDNELAKVKEHSPAGYDYLIKTNILDEEILRGVLHHHERYDGYGYPNEVKGREIPMWSRIISVADVYDALTSDRPYRTPMQPGEAIEYVMGGVGSSFDYDMVSAFLRKVEVYPIGTLVELSNHITAVVINNENQMRPVVRTENGEIWDLYRDRRCLSIVITRILDGFQKLT